MRYVSEYLALIILILILGNVYNLSAQGESENIITLSGTITCNDSIVGPLADVTIFNQNRSWGTRSDENGHFSLKAGSKDTIWFSTVQHREQFYVINDDEQLKDQEIAIFMEPDTVWLEAVTIYGYKSIEEFKREVLALDLPKSQDILIALPIIDRYSAQRETGVGKFSIDAPLTKLYLKLLKISRANQNLNN